MSHYVKDYDVLSAIKTVLDADAILDGLLDANTGESKVILGQEGPKICNLPVVHLFILTRTINPNNHMNDLLIRVMWFVSALPDGTEDIQSLSNIGERLFDLLNDVKPTVSGYQVSNFCAEAGESSALDLERPEGRDNHFQSLNFRMAIRRNA